MADERDDERWIEALAGRGGAEADAAWREAEALRAALLQALPEAELSQQETENGLQRLMFRLRREGLLGRTRTIAAWAPWAMAASLVLAVGLMTWGVLDREPVQEEFDFRGGNVQEIVAADPVAAADALAAGFRALDITVVRRDQKGASFVEALVQNRADPKLAELLARNRLKAGESGPILVRIVPPRK